MAFPRLTALVAAWLIVTLAARPAAAQVSAPDKVYTDFSKLLALPKLPSTEGSSEEPQAAVQRLLQLPPGTVVPDEQRVFVRFVVEKDGRVSHPHITQSAGAVLDTAVVQAVRRLPRFWPGQDVDAAPVRVALAVGVWPGGVPSTAVVYPAPGPDPEVLEAHTLRAGTATRHADETVADFLSRVLPASFAQADKPISYAWHPSAYGPQLFFSAPGHGEPMAEYQRWLFVLDPVGPTQYAVQTFHLEQGDITTLEALFFADANHDGQKDLLTLTECSLREGPSKDAPLGGRSPHYQTCAIYFRGVDKAGRPQYEQEPLEALDELATAAAVRQALAAPPRREIGSKRNPRVKAAK